MSQAQPLHSPAAEPARGAHGTPRLVWLLPLHALVWTIAAWLSRGNLDTQGDMIENYVWGIEWQAGYAKHPPLFAWITAAWFRLFPHVDIAYFALSALNAMTGLLGIVALAGRFLPRRLAVVAGLAMAVSPLYSNLAIKFNANSVLLSVWPWTAYFFVRFMQTGGWRAAIALGALAAAAVLGKYFSVVLLLALLLAALVRPAWRARLLRDWRSLLTVVAFVVVLTPHLHWLVVNHFPTFGYAEERTGGTLPAAVGRFGIYTLAQIGYLLLPFVFVVLLVRTRPGQAARQMAERVVRPSRCPDLWWLAMAPLFVVGAIAIAAKTQMASVWGMAQWFAIVPLWLSLFSADETRIAPGRAVRVMTGYWLIVLVAATATGYLGARHNTDDAAEPRAELSAAAHALWKQRTGQELAIVAGSAHEAQSTAFYSDGHTRFWSFDEPRTTPWLTPSAVAQRGALLVCRSNDRECLARAAAFSGTSPVAVDVHKKAWGMELPARHYQLFLMLPQATAAAGTN